MFRFLKKIGERTKDRFLHLLWFVLPKKTESFGETEVKYLIVPSFLINSAHGMVIYYRKSGRVMIFISLHRYGRRYTVFHEYSEGRLFQARRTEKQITQMIIDKLQLSPDLGLKEIEEEGRSLLERLIAFVGEPKKAQEIIEKASPEILGVSLKILKDAINKKGVRHTLAVLETLELVKKELSPEDFASFLYEDMGIEY